jgi:hypothetical protein
MNPSKAVPKSIRINGRSHRHLMAAAKYFDCPVSMVIMLLLEDSMISALDKPWISLNLKRKFFDELDERIKTDTYLFKD